MQDKQWRDEPTRRRAAEQGDPQAMFELAGHTEKRARRLLAEARDWYARSTHAGSLDARNAWVRLAAADGDYELAQSLLRDAEYAGVPGRLLVSVAPDVLGPGLPLDGDGEDDVPGAGTFTVISPQMSRAAAAVDRVARQLLNVNEHGDIQMPYDEQPSGVDVPYTPNFLFDVTWSHLGAMVSLDTKGSMTSAMGRTMVNILVDALVADGVPAHIVGYRPELDNRGWAVWKGRPPDA